MATRRDNWLPTLIAAAARRPQTRATGVRDGEDVAYVIAALPFLLARTTLLESSLMDMRNILSHLDVDMYGEEMERAFNNLDRARQMHEAMIQTLGDSPVARRTRDMLEALEEARQETERRTEE